MRDLEFDANLAVFVGVLLGVLMVGMATAIVAMVVP